MTDSTYRFLNIVGLSLILIVGSLIFLIFFISPRMSDDNNFVLPKYSQETVHEICLIFEVDVNDSFCSQTSIQDADTFETMLEHQYPIKETSYTTITSKLTYFESKPSYDCNDFLGSEVVWAIDNCPPPDKCLGGEPRYTCYFDVNLSEEEIVLRILFTQETGFVRGYGISRPGESGN